RSLPGKRPQTPTPSSSWRTCGKHSANRMQTSRRSPAPASKALNCHSSRHTAHLFRVRRFCHQKSVCKPCNGSPSVVTQGELGSRLCLWKRVLPQTLFCCDLCARCCKCFGLCLSRSLDHPIVLSNRRGYPTCSPRKQRTYASS